MTSLSHRASAIIEPNETNKLLGAVFSNPYSKTNQNGVLFMGIAENKLMHDELIAFMNAHLSVSSKMLTYNDGPCGTLELRTALAEYITTNFKSRTKVESGNVTVMNGVTSVIDAVSFCLAEEGEGILVAMPLYVGFPDDFRERSGVKTICVPMEGDDVTSLAGVDHHEAALIRAEKEGVKAKAIMLCNPHNPTGKCYSKEVIEAYLSLCSNYGIHLICDEVYARAVFPSNDIPKPKPFTSVLSLEIEKFIDPSMVHVLYGMSKDFCSNGLRIGAFISLHNPTLHQAMRCVARFSWASSLSQLAWTEILTDQQFLNSYFAEMERRMTRAYDFCTSLLKGMMIPYEPANVGQFIWLDLSGFLRSKTIEEERVLAWKMIESGVWLSTGEAFKSEVPGYFRLTFACGAADMKLGMDRLKVALENYLDWKAY